MGLQETASRLIKKFGENRLVKIQIPEAVPADPTKPWEVDPTSKLRTKTVNAVVVPIDRKLVDGNSVLDGDETMLIAGLDLGGLVPTPAFTVIDENVNKNIMKVDRVRPGKTDYLYKLQVRAP
jgi:hypothetical protein